MNFIKSFKFIFKKVTVAAFIFTIIGLYGCSTPALFHQTEANVADVALRTAEARHISDCTRTTPALVVKHGMYVDRTPIDLWKEPCWLRNQIVIRGDELPFSYYARVLASGGGEHILTRYQVGMDPAIRISMNYSGTVRGALDALAAKTGYIYNVHGNNVYWQAYVTKTFDIAYMPGQTDYLMGKQSGSTGGQGVSTPGGGNQVTAVIDDSAAQQFSSLKGTLSVWKDLETTIKQLLSPDGRVVVSESTSSVTVRDRPTNLALVSRYVCNLNSRLSKQVLVKVQILEVDLLSDYSYGINWDLVQRAFGHSNFLFRGNFGNPVSITPIGTGTTFTSFGLQQSAASAANANSTFITALIIALKQQGKVAIVSEPRSICLNNQVSTVRVTTQQGYLASLQTTTVAGGAAGAATVTSQITPGTVVTGLTLYILPKIFGTKVFLQINADIANLVNIQNVSSTAGFVAPTTTGTAPIIQVPTVAQKQFNQRTMLSSGETLVLSGFRKINNQTGAMQLFDSQAAGGRGARQNNSEIIILITPIILPGLG